MIEKFFEGDVILANGSIKFYKERIDYFPNNSAITETSTDERGKV